MSGEERQRILRRAGHNDPADAEREEHARSSREEASSDAAQRKAKDDEAVEPTPFAETDEGPPRPRR